MGSALVPGSSGPGSSPGRAFYAVFLGKTLYLHSNLRSYTPSLFLDARLFFSLSFKKTPPDRRLPSQCFSPAMCINSTREFNVGAGNPAMD